VSTAVIELTEARFDQEIADSPLPVVVEFWAQWCPPCKMMAPVLDSIAIEYHDRVRVFKINIDEQPALAARYEVMSVPTVLVFSNGEPRHRMIGARSRGRLLGEIGID
jgi:thioredoxin 1